jgi:CubicO group peptidase (beta-lactamase class C family)
VSDYLPEFRGEIGKVQLGQLLHHTGGLPDLINEVGQPVQYSVGYDYIHVDRDELLERAELAKLIFEPNEREEYSNLGFQLLAAVYEVVTGESYQSLLQQHIFEPAGMTDTGFWFDDGVKRQFVDGCRAGNSHWGNPIDDAMWDSTGPSWNLIGAGGLLSTAASLGLFFEGVGDGVYFQSPAQSEKYKDDRMVYSDSRKQRVMGPAGSNGIFNAVAFWADRSRFNIVLMTNRADHQAENKIFRDIISIFPADYFLVSE